MNDPVVLEGLTRITAFLNKFDATLQPDDIAWAFGALRTNAMSISVGKACGDNTALYPAIAAMASHACNANLERVTSLNGNHDFIQFRATRNIRRGEQLTIRYCEQIIHRQKRRMELREHQRNASK